MLRFFKTIFSRQSFSDKTFCYRIKAVTGIFPREVSIYREAFIHRSIIDKKNRNYERLEFLGDAILGLIVADWLYKKSPDKQEGYLTQMRSKIVSRKNLNRLGKELQLQKLIRSKNKNSKNILGDVLESLIGAIYIDHGYAACQKFINKKIIDSFINLAELENHISSHKNWIIQWAQKNKNSFHFITKEEKNAQKDRVFTSSLKINKKIISKGRAGSKKDAEEISAKRAYYIIRKNSCYIDNALQNTKKA